MRFTALTTAVLLAFGLSSAAWADGYFRPAMMYLVHGEESGGLETSTTRLLLDISAGYMHAQGWTIGALYGTERSKITTEYVGYELTTNSDRVSVGPSLGWTMQGNDGPYILGTYFLSSNYTQLTLDYIGDGFQVDIGYRFPIKRVHLGLQLSYKSFKYKKYRDPVSTTELSQPLKHTYLDPYFALFVQF